MFDVLLLRPSRRSVERLWKSARVQKLPRRVSRASMLLLMPAMAKRISSLAILLEEVCSVSWDTFRLRQGREGEAKSAIDAFTHSWFAFFAEFLVIRVGFLLLDIRYRSRACSTAHTVELSALVLDKAARASILECCLKNFFLTQRRAVFLFSS